MKISPARRARATTRVPGDKSISHRVGMIAALAEGVTTVENFATSRDCQSTLECLSALGIAIERAGANVKISGRGLNGLSAPARVLDAGNSGSTIRMLSGILAGLPFTSEITGDESLQRRPMKRIVTPLREMGAQIEATRDDYPPLRITGTTLTPIDYVMPVASAQVKSCVLLAGLFADGDTSVHEPAPTRNHTELMLQEFGARVEVDGNRITVEGRPTLQARAYRVPGDISSAAFFIAAALMLPDSQVVIEGVGINPTRCAIIDLLVELGAQIELGELRTQHGELVGDISVSHSRLRTNAANARLEGDIIANLIDEIPILAVLATQIEGGLEIRNAAELRVKESDRIRTVVDNLRAMGARVEEYPDGMAVAGGQQLKGARIDAAGDHRIAMAFAIGALAAQGETEIEGSESVDVSFPGFFDTLARIVEK